MAFILPRPGYFVKQRFLKRFRNCGQALVRIRYLVIMNNWNGQSAREIEKVLKIHNTTVYRVVRSFRERGEASLWDGREDNGHAKLDDDFLGLLDRVVRSSPQKHGWRRPTWTRETLVETQGPRV
jgi:transposase